MKATARMVRFPLLSYVAKSSATGRAVDRAQRRIMPQQIRLRAIGSAGYSEGDAMVLDVFSRVRFAVALLQEKLIH